MLLQALNQMNSFTKQITSYDESKVFFNQNNQYCSYFHIQFWGKGFPPELTHSEFGFIMRRKMKMEFVDITNELHALFGVDKKIGGKGKEIEIVTRTGPTQKIEQMQNHLQDDPLIAICLDLEPMTERMASLYRA